MFRLILVITFLAFDLCNAQTIKAPSVANTPRFYSGHGGYGNNCPITDCSSHAVTACTAGKYLSGCGGGTETGSCIACSGLPQNAEFTTNGGLSASGCLWRCLENYELSGGLCVLKTCASANEGALRLPSGISNIQYASDENGGAFPTCKYICMAGYSGPTASGDRGPSSCTQCAAGTAAVAGSSSCTPCNEGFSSVAGSATCTACLPNTFASSKNSASCSACQLCSSGYYKSGCGPISPGSCAECGNTGYTPPAQV
jgi:hypothetical protein